MNKRLLIFSGLILVMLQAAAQNVGINTANPQAMLHVKDSSLLLTSPTPLVNVTQRTPFENGGTGLMWYGGKALLRVGQATGNQWSAYLSGPLSVAFGKNNTALGEGAFVAGENSYASGLYSVVLGSNTSDVRERSVAIGNDNAAPALQSVAIGKGAFSYSYQGVATGRYNIIQGNNNAEVATDPVFAVGNGTSDASRSNALTILKNGNTGIGTTAPLAKLQVSNGSVLLASPYGSTTPVITNPMTSDGDYFYWDAFKGALRSGYYTYGQLHTDSIGDGSSALGSSAMAKASGSIALGTVTRATANSAVAIGRGVESPSYGEVSVGLYNSLYAPPVPQSYNTNDRIFSVGNGISNSNRSNALTILKNGYTGIGTDNPGARLEVVSTSNTIPAILAKHSQSVGSALRTEGRVQLTGLDEGAGKLLVSDANGYATWQNPATLSLNQAASGGSTSIQFRNNDAFKTSMGWDNSSERFYFYDGISGQNVFFIKGGRMGVRREATTNVLEVGGEASKATAGSWLGNSDARLKKNIVPIENALGKLLQLQGINYEWNDTETGYPRPVGIQAGFTAQNVQQVFPAMVSTDAQGYLQTAYGTYDPLIVEAIRELKAENDLLKKELAGIKELLQNRLK